MKAIPTTYNNIRFRSRLEAKWAVLMDILKIEWVYEQEGFDLSGTWYLPDFYLPTLRTFIEVKPISPNKKEIEKLKKLAISSRKKTIFLIGEPRDYINCYGRAELFIKDGWDNHYSFTKCLKCNKAGIEFEARTGRLKCKCKRINEKQTAEEEEYLNEQYFKSQNYKFC